MKKAIYMFVLGIMFLASSSLASAAWNTYPSDCPNSLSIGNYTTGDGIQDGSNGCWSRKSVSTSAGQTINVAVYYDNTNNVDANAALISLTQSPAGSMSSKNSLYTFSGNLTSYNTGSLYFSPVSVSISSAETLTFSRAKWFKKGSASGVSLPGGQDGSGVFGGGVSMANIANGDWGTVIFSFSVGTTTQPELCNNPLATNNGLPGVCILPLPPVTPTCRISRFDAVPSTITKGESSKLIWETTTSCTNITIYGVTIGTQPNSGSATVYPTTNTTYDLSAFYMDNGSVKQLTKSTTVSVNQPNIPTVTGTITATPNCTIPVGYSTCNTTLNWSTQNAVNTSAVSSNNSTIVTGNNGNKVVAIEGGTQTFYLYNTSILLSQASTTASCATGSTWTGTYCKTDTVPTMSGTISATPSSCFIQPGSSVCSIPFIWTTTNPVAVSAITNNGSTVATGNNGSAAFSITKGAQAFYLYNNRVELSYTTVTADCTVGSSWVAGVCKTDTPATNNNIINNNNVINSNNNTLIVNPPINPINPINPITPIYNRCVITNFSASDTNIEYGGYSTLRWNTSNCDRVNISNTGNASVNGSRNVYPTYDTTYTITAYDTNGSSQTDSIKIYVSDNHNNNNNYNYNCSIDSFTTNTTSINQGDSVTLRWNTSNCTNIDISNLGNVYSSGSQTFYPSSSTNYVLTARGSNGGTQTRSLWVNVNQTVNPIPVYNKNVVTTIATNISQNQAQINGYITNTTFYNSNVYFNYGTTVNLGSKTSPATISGNSTFNSVINGLAPNTIYFFQAVGENNTGIAKGNIEIFETLGNGVVKQVVVHQGTTIVGSASPVELKISNKYELIGQGDLIDYVVNYKNIGNAKLSKPMIQVVLPSNVTLVNASRGTYSVDTHTLSALIEDLDKGEEGVIYLQAKVESVPANNAQIVTTAILVYTNTNGAQENAMAYVLNVPKIMLGVNIEDNNNLGASAFFAGLVSIGLVGWLIIILIILLLILIVHSIYSRPANPTNTNPTH